MIFQEPTTSLNPCFTVGFQLDETLRLHEGMDRKAARAARASSCSSRSASRRRRAGSSAFPHQLSGGMNQRVMIAMAIACNPKLLIADEPTTALDVTIQAQILDLLLTLQRERGMALVLITHDMGVVAETAERVMVHVRRPDHGGAPSAPTLFAAPQHPYTAALLAALPERSARRGCLPTIPGVVPGVFDRRPAACSARAARYATEHCRARAAGAARDGPAAGSAAIIRSGSGARCRDAADPGRVGARRMTRRRVVEADDLEQRLPGPAAACSGAAAELQARAAASRFTLDRGRRWRWSANPAAASRRSRASSP